MAKNSKSSSEISAVDLPEVERILDFMQTHGLEEFEYERNGFRIRLRRPTAATPASVRSNPVLEPAAPAPALASAPAAPKEVVAQAALPEDLHVIKSPIVGTFYPSPTPGADPFVKLGSRVDTGQVLCIIEAMKLMNEIESDVAGEVVRVFVENGHPVEYGQALFGIRPDRKT
jgi:acetyl-CoA carboxylase biotin carboxyl carrier protein